MQWPDTVQPIICIVNVQIILKFSIEAKFYNKLLFNNL